MKTYKKVLYAYSNSGLSYWMKLNAIPEENWWDYSFDTPLPISMNEDEYEFTNFVEKYKGSYCKIVEEFPWAGEHLHFINESGYEILFKRIQEYNTQKRIVQTRQDLAKAFKKYCS